MYGSPRCYGVLDLALSLVPVSSPHCCSNSPPSVPRQTGGAPAMVSFRLLKKSYKAAIPLLPGALTFSARAEISVWRLSSAVGVSHNHSYPLTTSSCNRLWPQIQGTDMCRVPRTSAISIGLSIDTIPAWARPGQLALASVRGLPWNQPSKHPPGTSRGAAATSSKHHLGSFPSLVRSKPAALPHPVPFAKLCLEASLIFQSC